MPGRRRSADTRPTRRRQRATPSAARRRAIGSLASVSSLRGLPRNQALLVENLYFGMLAQGLDPIIHHPAHLVVDEQTLDLFGYLFQRRDAGTGSTQLRFHLRP